MSTLCHIYLALQKPIATEPIFPNQGIPRRSISGATPPRNAAMSNAHGGLQAMLSR
jgi:hypothetical protein